MDAYEAVITKLDFREFSPKKVPADVKLKVLEAARHSPTGMNVQHWKFILVQEKNNIKKLAQDSTSGPWVAGADFAVIVLTTPKYGFHLIDAGRAVQNMQIAAWNYGVISGVYTGVNADVMRKDFGIPPELNATIVVGFGYPARKVTGKKKNRKPLAELAFLEKYANPVDPRKLSA